MKNQKSSVEKALILCFTVLATLVIAIPQNMSISGFLTNEANVPINGSFEANINFYDQEIPYELYRTETFYDTSETNYNPVSRIATTIRVEEGVFNRPIPIPETILGLNEVWYTLAIDANGNGIGVEDFFDEMFEVTSVPFAQTVQPVTLFETMAPNIEFAVNDSYPVNTAAIAPFSAPPGGVVFNRLGITLERIPGPMMGIRYMFGVYDEDGDLLFSSPVVPDSFTGLPVYEINGMLQPSKTYYAAFWAQEWNFASPATSTPPAHPGYGILLPGGDDNGLFRTLDFSTIERVDIYPVFSLNFYQVDPSDPPNFQENDGQGFNYSTVPPMETSYSIRSWRLDQ